VKLPQFFPSSIAILATGKISQLSTSSSFSVNTILLRIFEPDYSFSCRILLVDPVKGLTGVLVLESGKPTTSVQATPEHEEWVRADLERHGALSKKPTDICP
jgi:hypothetical protein